MKKSFFIYLLISFFAASAFAQEKPVRIGLKFGLPNIAGLNFEYVTPSMDGKLAPTADFSYFSIGDETDGKFSFSYIEIGGNYYFKEKGKGLYGHLSYGRVSLKGTYDDILLGKGEGKVGLNLVNVKIGAKLGNGFYFRPEIGFAAGGGGTMEIEYNGTTEQEDVPALFGGVVFNLGFGVAF
jgi:hypothetical protein